MTAHQDLARVLWPQATVSGDGRFALVHICGRPTVELRPATQRPRSARVDCDCSELRELVLNA